jgi:DNA-directed RNA polymerase specialized sigma24 family protein
MTGTQLEFTSFYSAAKDDCLRIVLVTVADRQLAEDLVAEAFTRAWASWRTVRRHPAPRAWVVRTALNLHVSWWRRRRRETALDGRVPAVPEGGDSGPDEELLAALRQLPARQQQVIILRVFFDLDAQATAVSWVSRPEPSACTCTERWPPCAPGYPHPPVRRPQNDRRRRAGRRARVPDHRP